MSRTQPLQQVDLTAPSESLTYVEVLTPGGIVRVNTNLVDTRTGAPVVVVEIERQVPYRPNTRYQEAHVPPSGEWAVEVDEQFGGLRTDITLTREKEGQQP